MSDYCTIFCTRLDYQVATEVVKLVFGPAAIEISGQEYRWQTITVTTAGTTLVLKSKARGKRGREFSNLIDRTLAHFRRAESGRLAHRDRALSVLQACQMVIGVAAEPGFNQKAGHYDCIFALTRALDGLIFNGAGLMDENGAVLLASRRLDRAPSP